VNWSALEPSVIYGTTAAFFWFDLVVGAKSNQKGTAFGLLMFGRGLFALGFTLAAIINLGLAILPALSK
jgi:hypothetical protein